MTKQISNESLPDNDALADRLQNETLPQILANIDSMLRLGKNTNAHYYREQYAITEAIIYALRNDRIARTDEDVERLVSDK
jgi:hypothetical protein